MLLTLSAKFRPFSFDEMVKPLVLYKDAYEKLEEKYDDLVTNTEKWRDMVDETGSPEAYIMYKKYSDQLNLVVDDFMQGMNMWNRGLLSNMRRQYAKSIIPIENAKKNYDKMVETREKIKAADDSAIFPNKYNSIDDFLHGKVADNSYISGNKVYTKLAALLEAYGRSAQGKMEIALSGVSKGYNDVWVQQNGYTIDDVMEVLNGNPNSKAALSIRQIIDSTKAGIGFENLTKLDQDFLYDGYIVPAVYNGLSKPAYQIASSGLDKAQSWEMANKEFNQRVLENQQEQKWKYYSVGLHVKDQFIDLIANGLDVSTARELTGYQGKIDESKINIAGKNTLSNTIDKQEKKVYDTIIQHGDIRTEKQLSSDSTTKRIRIQCTDGTQFDVIQSKDNNGNWRSTGIQAVSKKVYRGNAQANEMPSVKGDLAGKFGVKISGDEVIESNINPSFVLSIIASSKAGKEKAKTSDYQLGDIDSNGIYLGGGSHKTLKNPQYTRASELYSKDRKAYNALVKFLKQYGIGEQLSDYYIWRDGDDMYLVDSKRYPNGVKNFTPPAKVNKTNNIISQK